MVVEVRTTAVGMELSRRNLSARTALLFVGRDPHEGGKDMPGFYLEYELTNGESVILGFDDENDRDGCHISLDMYKAQLGPVDEDVLQRILQKFHGVVMSRS